MMTNTNKAAAATDRLFDMLSEAREVALESGRVSAHVSSGTLWIDSSWGKREVAQARAAAARYLRSTYPHRQWVARRVRGFHFWRTDSGLLCGGIAVSRKDPEAELERAGRQLGLEEGAARRRRRHRLAR